MLAYDITRIGMAMLIIHEAGHFGMAAMFKLHPKPKIENWKPVIRFDTPKNDTQKRLIMQSGFVAEMLLGLVLAFLANPLYFQIFMPLLFIHFTLYPWTARYSYSNDFNGMGSIKKEESKDGVETV